MLSQFAVNAIEQRTGNHQATEIPTPTTLVTTNASHSQLHARDDALHFRRSATAQHTVSFTGAWPRESNQYQQVLEHNAQA
jgi:hypothetical protein